MTVDSIPITKQCLKGGWIYRVGGWKLLEETQKGITPFDSEWVAEEWLRLLPVSITSFSAFIGLLWKGESENEKEECLKVPFHLYMSVLNA